ncbi:hypothetical protein EVAR_80804_1 [Eumeta japonica]|uniref:Uncharacterized protein n=1 Tax=Eumeta variegata TaxID=151549 RepID=A0A4C1WCL1_EUMVA|nr:hypothetical protein EVAR_80804_1 [Eumeta japonica]
MRRCEFGMSGTTDNTDLGAQKSCASSACRRCGKPERITGTNANVAQLLPRDGHCAAPQSHINTRVEPDTLERGSDEH